MEVEKWMIVKEKVFRVLKYSRVKRWVMPPTCCEEIRIGRS